RTVTVRPSTHWPAGTYEVLTVDAGALAATGRPMATVVRAAFVTRPSTTARVSATKVSGTAALPSTGFLVTFDSPVAARDIATAIRITPRVAGSVNAVTGRPDATPEMARTFLFTPNAPLAAATRYTVSLGRVLDPDGAPVLVDDSLTVTTSTAPGVVRFRPGNGARDVERTSVLSIRFTDSMDRVTTTAALKVTANGVAVGGSTRFAEASTVLVFRPASALPAGATVVLSVGSTATSTHGVPLAAAVTATIHTKAAPKPAVHAPRSAPNTHHGSGGGGGGGGGAVGGGSWGAVETYYLRLMNCTRTGGWVTSSGSCSSPGGRGVAPLRLDAGISSKVSRPYAKKLAVNNLCTHFSGGNPGDRLRAAGYTSYRWGENLGCRSGNARAAVLGSHLFFQAEKSTNGGHYVNLMNAAYDRCGIGVWVSGGRVRLVIDFYHPR
ncbi:MAG TPA: Ig-like domain-containing protein, partial [Candidatus Limnocylindrales bacterium]|nr:Ig-like domain-containing protein [Candidatus Limnocylindrales bacterium]